MSPAALFVAEQRRKRKGMKGESFVKVFGMEEEEEEEEVGGKEEEVEEVEEVEEKEEEEEEEEEVAVETPVVQPTACCAVQ